MKCMELNPDLNFVWGPIQIPTQKRVKKLDPFLIYYHYLFQFRSSKYYGTHFHLQGPNWNQPKSIHRYLKIGKGVTLLDKGGGNDYAVVEGLYFNQKAERAQAMIEAWRYLSPPTTVVFISCPPYSLAWEEPSYAYMFWPSFQLGDHLG